MKSQYGNPNPAPIEYTIDKITSKFPSAYKNCARWKMPVKPTIRGGRRYNSRKVHTPVPWKGFTSECSRFLNLSTVGLVALGGIGGCCTSAITRTVSNMNTRNINPLKIITNFGLIMQLITPRGCTVMFIKVFERFFPGVEYYNISGRFVYIQDGQIISTWSCSAFKASRAAF